MKSFTKLATLGLMAAVAIIAPVAASSTANAEITQTATFTVIQPANAFSQWTNVWTHVYNVDVDENGNFTGSGLINGYDAVTTFNNEPENVTGTFHLDGTVSLTATRPNDGVTWSLDHAIADGEVVNRGTLVVPNDPSYLLETKVTAPRFTAVDPAPVVLGNHGDCVSSAAHAGIKGKALADIAKVVTKTGNYGSTNCPLVPVS